MKLDGVHHVTAITGDAPRNVDFYTRVLGMRLVKKTVNQDDPTVYHLFYGDEQGSPGLRPDVLRVPRRPARPRRRRHGPHRRVPRAVAASLDFWAARARRRGDRRAALRRTRCASTTPRA